MVQMNGTLLESALSNNSFLASQLFSAIVGGNSVSCTVQGLDAVVDGDTIPWLTNIITAIDAPIVLQRNISSLLGNLALSDLALTLTPDGGSMSANITTGISCTLLHTRFLTLVPFKFPLEVISVATSMDILSPDNQTVATLFGGPQAAQSTNTTLTTSINNATLDIVDVNGFGDIIQEDLLQNSATFGVRGYANTTVQTPIGNVNISGISFQQTFTFQGTPSTKHHSNKIGSKGFGGAGVQLGTANVIGSDVNGIYLTIPVSLSNPSDITASVGTIYFELLYENITVGVVRLDDFVAAPGPMSFTSHVYLTASPSDLVATTALQSLLSNFAMGNVIQTVFSGSMSNSTDIPCLQGAMAGIELSGQVAGLKTQLIGKSTLNLGLVDILENGFSADVNVTNRMFPV